MIVFIGRELWAIEVSLAQGHRGTTHWLRAIRALVATKVTYERRGSCPPQEDMHLALNMRLVTEGKHLAQGGPHSKYLKNVIYGLLLC